MKIQGPERGRSRWERERGLWGPTPGRDHAAWGTRGHGGPRAPTPLRRPGAGGAGAGPAAGRGRAGGWAGVPGAGAGPGWRCAAAGRPPRMRGSHGCSRRRCHSREHEGPNPGAPHGESGPRAPPLTASVPRPARRPLPSRPRRPPGDSPCVPGRAGGSGAEPGTPTPLRVPPLGPTRGHGLA